MGHGRRPLRAALVLALVVTLAHAQLLQFDQLGLVVDGPQDSIVIEKPAAFQGRPISSGNVTLAEQFPIAVLSAQLAWLVTALGAVGEYYTPRDPSPSPSPSPSPPPATPEYYVQVDGGQFITGEPVIRSLQCTVMYPAGTSKFEFVEAGAGAPVLLDGKLAEPGLTAQAVVRCTLDDAQATGINLLRINAFAVDSQYKVLRQAPSGITYNEGVLAGLDYVLEEARKRGIRVLLVLTDYFSDNAGGPLQYLELAGLNNVGTLTTEEFKSFFYTNGAAQAIYRDYIQAIVNRVNTINGRTYKSDPTIFGWDIMNEPRCEYAATNACVSESDGSLVIRNWAASIAAFVKSLDSIHPVTVGLDGFYTSGPGLAVNPFSVAANYGNDFVQVSSVPQLDFASFNVYPDLWNQQNQQWVIDWITQHAQDGANVLGKPVIIKELGMQPIANRDPFYAQIYAEALAQIAATRNAAGGLRGAAYFQAFAEGTEAVWWTQAPGGRWGIFKTDAAYQSVEDFASAVANLEAQSSTLCPLFNPNIAPVILPIPACRTGFEGPHCDLDINECVRGTDDCDLNAACINTVGSFQCQCFTGFIGDGRTCTPDNAALALIEKKYYTNFGGNCLGQPTDVPFPSTSPGWVYDPTNTFPADGNRVNVTLLECKTACDDAVVCTSFFWDQGQKQCFLKAGECPYGDICVNPPAVCSGLNYTGVPPADPVSFNYICGQGYTYYKKNAALPSNCNPPSAATISDPSLGPTVTTLAAIPKKPASGADLALVFRDISGTSVTDTISLYNIHNGDVTNYFTFTTGYLINRMAVLPNGLISFISFDTAVFTVFLEDDVGSQTFSSVLVGGNALAWQEMGAGGNESSQVLWGVVVGSSGRNGWTFEKLDPSTGIIVETASLPSSADLTTLHRLAVDPQGSLWVVMDDAGGNTYLFKYEGGNFATKQDSAVTDVGLCDLSFDVFGYLFATGYDKTVAGNDCNTGTTIYKSDTQIGVLPLDPVSLTDVFPALAIDAPKLNQLAAGPHSASDNSRGGLAVVFWPAQDDTVRYSANIYAPNLGPSAS